MKRTLIYFSVPLLLLIACQREIDAPYVNVKIINYSPIQPIAFKLPNKCWYPLYPGDTYTVDDVEPLENTLLIAFADSDDPDAFARVKWGYYCSNGYPAGDVDPPRTKIKSFSFDSRRKAKVPLWSSEPDVNPEVIIVAEEIGANGLLKFGPSSTKAVQGIETIRFRVVK